MPTICVDIDGVLTNETEGHGYLTRTPNKENIKLLWKLWEKGYCIILYTARPVFASDMQSTIFWLKKHHVPYEFIQFGKPKADFYIDDKHTTLEELCK